MSYNRKRNFDGCDDEGHYGYSPSALASSTYRVSNPSIGSRSAECRKGFQSVLPNTTRGDGRNAGTTPKMPIQRSCSKEFDIQLNRRNSEDLEAVSALTDNGCVSLRHRRRAPCAKPLSTHERKPRCPARGPEVSQESYSCRENEKAKRLRKPSRKLTPRRSREKADRCEESPDVRVACGIGAEEYETGLITEKNKNPKNFAKEKSCCYQERNHANSQRKIGIKPCASDKRRNMLKTQLKQLVSETMPIPESCLLEITESKPEPEIVADVLLMSDAEGIDLAQLQPANVFDNLFSDLSNDRSIMISRAAPEFDSNIVVPVSVSGKEASSFEIPNTASIIDKTESFFPPNTDAFDQSTVYKSLQIANELLYKQTDNLKIAELLGESTMVDETTPQIKDSIVDYIIKPRPSSHTNRFRLNGSMKPAWFPGYTLVSPAVAGCTRITNDPAETLNEAWKNCHPRNFDENSKFLVDI